MKTILSLILLMFLSSASFAQYYSTGQDPSHLKWKQINTNDFRIVFPTEYETKARYLAALFQDLKTKGGKDLQHTPKKFSVILHTQSATSNGLVAWAPKRMELYATPPQNDRTQAWLDHLATHEYRHVLQMDDLERGFTRVLNTILGQQATALVVGLYLPFWFMEGDAVCAETALSESGRGREPEFEQELRAQLLEKGTYSYDKAVMGSYKDYIPNRYTLGYYLVGKSRLHYGDEFWRNTIVRIGESPMKVNCFSAGLKMGMKNQRQAMFQELQERQTAYLSKDFEMEKIDWNEVKELNANSDGKLMLYADVMSELKWEWRIQDKENEISSAKKMIADKTLYTNYRFPHIDTDGKLLLTKNGLADAQAFVSLDVKGNEKEVFVPGFDYQTSYDYNKGKLLWAEHKAHVRWQHADKAVIVSYDTQSGKRRTYKQKLSCFAPVFSADGSRILAVEVSSNAENDLVIIDATSGKIVKRLAAKDDEFFMTPQWAKNDKSLVVIVQSGGEKHLEEINLESENRTVLYHSGKTNISQPAIGEKHVFFTSSHTGIDNVFAYTWETGLISQLTSSRFGARDPYYHAASGKLYYSDYSSDGHRPVNVDLDACLWKKQEGEAVKFSLAEQLSEQLGEKLHPDTTNLDQWEVEPYSRMAHLFKFHSWAPLFISAEEGSMDIGVSASSQNLLNTLFTTVGYKKEEGYDNGQLYLNLSYQRFFPIFNSKIEYGKQSLAYSAQIIDSLGNNVGTLPLNTEWKQLAWENSVSLPFNLSSGKYSTFLTTKFSYNLYQSTGYQTRITSPDFDPQSFDLSKNDQTFDELEYQLFFSHAIKSSKRDLQSSWAQYIQLDYRSSPDGDYNIGNVWSGIGLFYFPGLAKHHGLSVYAGYQHRSKLNSSFGNGIKSPRGVSDLFGQDCMTMSLDYRMPIAYPDWSMGGLAYIKRIKMVAFIDYGLEQGSYISNDAQINFDNRFTSAGLEITGDMHLFRLPIPLNVGFRIGYENETNAVFGNLLLSYSLDF